MWMRLQNKELLMTDAENASIFGPHFYSAFGNHRPIDWPVLENIKHRDVMEELNQPISWDEMKKATTKLSNDKAPGLNGVPPNTSKALDNVNLSWLMIFYNQFWPSKADFGKWHEGQIVPVPKKGDTSNPNDRIGVALMDTGNKIYSSIICGQLFKIIRKHGMKYQFGSTPGV